MEEQGGDDDDDDDGGIVMFGRVEGVPEHKFADGQCGWMMSIYYYV